MIICGADGTRENDLTQFHLSFGSGVTGVRCPVTGQAATNTVYTVARPSTVMSRLEIEVTIADLKPILCIGISRTGF